MHFYIYVCMELNKNIFKGLALAAGFFIYFVGALRQGQTWSVPQKVQIKKRLNHDLERMTCTLVSLLYRNHSHKIRFEEKQETQDKQQITTTMHHNEDPAPQTHGRYSVPGTNGTVSTVSVSDTNQSKPACFLKGCTKHAYSLVHVSMCTCMSDLPVYSQSIQANTHCFAS